MDQGPSHPYTKDDTFRFEPMLLVDETPSAPSLASRMVPRTRHSAIEPEASQGTALFLPLPTNTISALESVPTCHTDVQFRDCDVGDDILYAPSDNLAALRIQSSAGSISNAGDDMSEELDQDDYYLEDLDDVGEWATSPAGCRANLTARVRPRNNANSQHVAAIDRLHRAEDKRREHVARDKLDRATVEQVLDPRTRMILFRLLSRGKLSSLDGCVSTGKEANVYYGTGGDNIDVAVKVFKTAILSFKDRERYVAGEFRFRRSGYNRSSNRKMVQQWAEKEFRNLMRLQEAGIHAPTPLIVKPPVLVMTFFGQGGWPAPRLKDAALNRAQLSEVYVQVCCLMRRMYHGARLVHGDLSEYNILYHQGQAVIIDVSQSVEDDHPMALDFLRRDCFNINEYFNRGGVYPVLGVRELFEFVTGFDSEKEDADSRDHHAAMVERFASRLEIAESRDENERLKIAADDKVFIQTYIPRALRDIVDHEGEILKEATAGADSVLFGKLANLSISSIHPASAHESFSNRADDDDGVAGDVLGSGVTRPSTQVVEDDVLSTSASSCSSWSDDDRKVSPEETKKLRKDQKKSAKAAAREKREQKKPKHVKKRKETMAKRRRHLKA